MEKCSKQKVKITAYRLTTDPLDLIPAKKKREWMDNTIHKFAYRCLPLSIANSTGWLLVTKHPCVVNWNGGTDIKDLSVHIDADTSEFAASNFGNGIVTFQPGYLFKTSPGWDMYVTGPPNEFIDFMQPLTGIVETNWLNSTFTMNWQLVKKGYFTIPAGTPICQILPIPHYDDIEFDVTERSITDDIEVFNEFAHWSMKRAKKIADLHSSVTENKSVGSIDLNDPNTHWDKDYMKGLDMKGKKQYNHTTNIKFPKFKKDT